MGQQPRFGLGHWKRTLLCASPCWTRWQVGTKGNESFRNITWHPQIKKDYGTTTKIRTWTLKTNALTAPATIGQGSWLWSHQVMTFCWANCHPLLFRRISRRWLEPSKALKGWGMDLFWWTVAKGPRPKTYSEQTDLLTDQSGSQFTRPWTPFRE